MKPRLPHLADVRAAPRSARAARDAAAPLLPRPARRGRSRSNRSRLASATAQPSWFPVYEWPWKNVLRSAKSPQERVVDRVASRASRRPGGSRRSGPCRPSSGRARRPRARRRTSRPVRPKPVATSSAKSSTSCSRQSRATSREEARRHRDHPAGRLHERLDDEARESRRAAARAPRAARPGSASAHSSSLPSKRYGYGYGHAARPGRAAARTRRGRGRSRPRSSRRSCRRGSALRIATKRRFSGRPTRRQ